MKKIEDKLLNSDSNKIHWIKVDKESDLKKGFDNEKYYGAIKFEKDFSKNAMSKTQKVMIDSKKSEMKEKVKSGDMPVQQAQHIKDSMKKRDVDVKQANLKLIVSQGSNMQASNIVTNVLSGLGQKLNQQITKQSLSTLQKQNVVVKPADVQGITNPVKVNKQNVNKIKDHQGGGNAPFLMFMPVWMGSLITSVLLFYAFRTTNNLTIQNRIIASFGQIFIVILAAFLGSFIYIYFMKEVLGFNFDQPNKVALFIAISIMGFVGLILGILVWLGMKSLPIFILLMFFSMQLVTLPKQMLPEGYQKWVYDWNPFTQYATSLKELIYLHQPIEFNSTLWMLIGFMLFGVVSSIVAAILRKHSNKRKEVPS